jgi:hypothetical protein
LISNESVIRNFSTVGVHSGFTPQYYAEYLKKNGDISFTMHTSLNRILLSHQSHKTQLRETRVFVLSNKNA